MTAQAAERGGSITEHILQSLIYHLRTKTLPVYLPDGSLVERSLPEVIPGIIIRPPKNTSYRGYPEINLNAGETNHPYLTVFKRPSGPLVGEMYGGGYAEPSFWEINVRLGEQTFFDYMALGDWVRGFLFKYYTLPIYFYSYTPGTSPSRGDEIASMHITNISVEESPNVSFDAGDSGGVIANFTITVFYAPEER